MTQLHKVLSACMMHPVTNTTVVNYFCYCPERNETSWRYCNKRQTKVTKHWNL